MIKFSILNIVSINRKVNINKIVWSKLSYNPNAICPLRSNRDKINWNYLSSNPDTKVYLVKSDPDKIDWLTLSGNSKDIDKINMYWFSRNPNALSYLEKNIDKINWLRLSENPYANLKHLW